MKKAISVAVYGNNVVMSSLCAGLQKRSDLEVRRLDKDMLCDDAEGPDVGLPDVILFDLAAGQPDFAIPAMQRNPAMLLIGVDLTSHRMLVLSGEQSRLTTADDLMQVIGQAKIETKQVS